VLLRALRLQTRWLRWRCGARPHGLLRHVAQMCALPRTRRAKGPVPEAKRLWHASGAAARAAEDMGPQPGLSSAEAELRIEECLKLESDRACIKFFSAAEAEMRIEGVC
jgi:hypothetical protein